jgi:hypothetical protein
MKETKNDYSILVWRSLERRPFGVAVGRQKKAQLRDAF